MTQTHRLAAAYLLIVVVGAATSRCGPAHARAERPLDPRERLLAFNVAKVATNEGALWNVKDTDLVWQTVEHRGDDTESRLKWLSSHSPRALGLKPCKSGNCMWARNLTRRADALPAGIASGKGGPKDWEAYWRAEMAPRWKAVLERAEGLVSGAIVDRPCSDPPDTWGGHMDWDQAVARGLIPLDCEGTLNRGWAMPDYRGLPGGFDW